jgi:4-alpha-glucanotransferase
MRINEPGTVKAQNWSIKFSKETFTCELQNKLKTLTKKYKR